MALPKLVVLLGTTACGKSGLGVTLAQRFDGEIVSADSRQVYRGLDLGTGKVTPAETEGICHHMLDVVAPNAPYSVAEFQQGAYEAIDGILTRGRTPFLVGGTGLYVRAVAQGYTFCAAPPDPVFRDSLACHATPALYAMLQEKTGAALNQSERQNRQRLIRLLEKAQGGGGLEESQRAPRYDVLQLGMTFPRDELHRRIDQRLIRRLDDGMVEEVAALRACGVSDAFLEGLGLEYRYILWYLTGKLQTRAELIDVLGRAIKQFSKRQAAWFKRDTDLLWLDMAGDPVAQASQAVAAFLAG